MEKGKHGQGRSRRQACRGLAGLLVLGLSAGPMAGMPPSPGAGAACTAGPQGAVHGSQAQGHFGHEGPRRGRVRRCPSLWILMKTGVLLVLATGAAAALPAPDQARLPGPTDPGPSGPWTDSTRGLYYDPPGTPAEQPGGPAIDGVVSADRGGEIILLPGAPWRRSGQEMEEEEEEENPPPGRRPEGPIAPGVAARNAVAQELLERALTLLQIQAGPEPPPGPPPPGPPPLAGAPVPVAWPPSAWAGPITTRSTASPQNLAEAVPLIYQALYFTDAANASVYDQVFTVIDALGVMKEADLTVAYTDLAAVGFELQGSSFEVLTAGAGPLPPPQGGAAMAGALNSTIARVTGVPLAAMVQTQQSVISAMKQQLQAALQNGTISMNVYNQLNFAANQLFVASSLVQSAIGSEERGRGNRAAVTAVRRLIEALKAPSPGPAPGPPGPAARRCLAKARKEGHPDLIMCYQWRLDTTGRPELSNQTVVLEFRPDKVVKRNSTCTGGRRQARVQAYRGTVDVAYELPGCGGTAAGTATVSVQAGQDHGPPFAMAFTLREQGGQVYLDEQGGEGHTYVKLGHPE